VRIRQDEENGTVVEKHNTPTGEAPITVDGNSEEFETF